MKAIHNSWPVGQRAEATMILHCPFSIALRWRFRNKYHSLDAVAYGPLVVSHEQ
jgi:hypothetical protein